MKDTIVKQCVDILKRDDVKHELKVLFTPLINFILYEINPYVYTIVTIILLLFIMNLTIIFILLFMLRNKQSFFKSP
jgi:hypothetical protein